MVKITFINQAVATARIPRAVICKTLAKAQTQHRARLGSRRVSVVFMAPAGAQKLNARYRGKNKPTNVLSFAASGAGELGDIIICPAIARSEAKERGETFAAWVNYLFIHGLLHLLGFDHNNNKAAKQMLAAEAKLQ
ncbi:MAG: rRNA maturation RNase YbeY [Patescibacteria group bacterium]